MVSLWLEIPSSSTELLPPRLRLPLLLRPELALFSSTWSSGGEKRPAPQPSMAGTFSWRNWGTTPVTRQTARLLSHAAVPLNFDWSVWRTEWWQDGAFTTVDWAVAQHSQNCFVSNRVWMRFGGSTSVAVRFQKQHKTNPKYTPISYYIKLYTKALSKQI